MGTSMWEVTGGEQTGGLVVRSGADLSSKKLEGRLSTGARVQQLDLQGDRLHYRLLTGAGPAEGWVSLKLKDKPLLQLHQETTPNGSFDLDSLFGPLTGDDIEIISLSEDVRVRIATISDIHVDQKINMEWFQKHLPRKAAGQFNVMILPGDVSDDVAVLQKTFKMLTDSFDLVCYTAGNHDLWVRRPGSPDDSLTKLRQICKICDAFSVRVRPVHLRLPNARDVLILPLLSFYASAWDQEPDLVWCPPEQKAMTGWLDFRILKWPQQLIDEVVRREGEFKFGKDGTSTAISEIFAQANEPLLERVEAMKQSNGGDDDFIAISFSHYLPRQELFPEKRFLVDSTLPKVSGSVALEKQIRRLQPEVHIFGHSHLTVDNVVEGQRYLQWALGYPQEQKGMSKAVGETGILVVFDSGGDEPHIAPIQETFWGRYFAKGVRDPSQTCPPPFLRDMFLKMFDVKLPFSDEYYFKSTPNPGHAIPTYEGLYDPRWRL